MPTKSLLDGMTRSDFVNEEKDKDNTRQNEEKIEGATDNLRKKNESIMKKAEEIDQKESKEDTKTEEEKESQVLTPSMLAEFSPQQTLQAMKCNWSSMPEVVNLLLEKLVLHNSCAKSVEKEEKEKEDSQQSEHDEKILFFQHPMFHVHENITDLMLTTIEASISNSIFCHSRCFR